MPAGIVTLKVAPPPGVVKSIPKVAVPPVTVTGTMKLVGMFPATLIPNVVGFATDSKPLAGGVLNSIYGFKVSVMASKKLPELMPPAALIAPKPTDLTPEVPFQVNAPL